MTGIKTGGRQQGTPNKITKDLRDILKSVIANELETIESTLSQLEAKERLEMILKLMSYVMPKVQTIESSYDALGEEW
jgi:hypothetical protein